MFNLAKENDWLALLNKEIRELEAVKNHMIIEVQNTEREQRIIIERKIEKERKKNLSFSFYLPFLDYKLEKQ